MEGRTSSFTYLICIVLASLCARDLRHSPRKYKTARRLSLPEIVLLLNPGGGEGGTPYNDLYEVAPPERGTFFTPQVYERVGISRVEVYERVGKSVI